MELIMTTDGANATIAPVGNLTVATAPGLESAFTGLPVDVVDVTLDLAEVDYVASAGLRVIVAQEKRARKRGGSLRIVNPNEEVAEVFDITGLVEVLNIVR